MPKWNTEEPVLVNTKEPYALRSALGNKDSANTNTPPTRKTLKKKVSWEDDKDISRLTPRAYTTYTPVPSARYSPEWYPPEYNSGRPHHHPLHPHADADRHHTALSTHTHPPLTYPPSPPYTTSHPRAPPPTPTPSAPSMCRTPVPKLQRKRATSHELDGYLPGETHVQHVFRTGPQLPPRPRLSRSPMWSATPGRMIDAYSSDPEGFALALVPVRHSWNPTPSRDLIKGIREMDAMWQGQPTDSGSDSDSDSDGVSDPSPLVSTEGTEGAAENEESGPGGALGLTLGPEAAKPEPASTGEGWRTVRPLRSWKV
ncbi:uncharacterized protein EHS24_006890 [Apiotrichum porosum]|uniref:Uncharacterized protein n=1 Tax=Apiotrichum porosum TaxID=105984 RepID=A0A427XWL2_9TREE|nr:uncharacterized protein EHS24_006890 [Apiotrichum porosum]RSH83223.1 hypothetical protein EHS24_006890 [Apiotrichum porosum]